MSPSLSIGEARGHQGWGGFLGSLCVSWLPSAPGRAWSRSVCSPSWSRGASGCVGQDQLLFPGGDSPPPPPSLCRGGKGFLWRFLKYLVLTAPPQPPTCCRARLANPVPEKQGSCGTTPLPERGEVIDKRRPKMCRHALYMRELYLIEYLQADFYFSVSQIMI